MAQNRRMFSNRIANSAKFLQMSTEAQLLYFHMVLRADDDGVVESYPLMKLLGLPTDNFKLLLVKGFIKQLNEDQVIVIVDWLEHNKIRADRKIDSIYLELLKEKCPEIETINPKPRVDVMDNSKRLGGGQSTDGISKDKLSKDKLSKDNNILVKPSFERKDQDIFNLIELFKEINPSYKQFFGNKTERACLERMLKEQGLEKLTEIIKTLPQTNKMDFAPIITSPYKLEKKLGDLISFMQRKRSDGNNPKYVKIK